MARYHGCIPKCSLDTYSASAERFQAGIQREILLSPCLLKARGFRHRLMLDDVNSHPFSKKMP